MCIGGRDLQTVIKSMRVILVHGFNSSPEENFYA